MNINNIETFEQFVESISEIFNEEKHFPRQWITGGVHGGTHLNKGNGHSVKPHNEPVDKYIPAIVNHVHPKITSKQMKKLMSNENLWCVKNEVEKGVHGNYIEYKEKQINFEKLFHALKQISSN